MSDANEIIQISASGFFINCTHSFTMQSVTPSNPDDHFPLRFFTTFSTWFSDTGLMNIVCGHAFIFEICHITSCVCSTILVCQFLYSFKKYELNNSAIALGFDILFFPQLNSIYLLFMNDFPS